MKLKLTKKKLKNLSQDKKQLPQALTPKVGGGVLTQAYTCYVESRYNSHCM